MEPFDLKATQTKIGLIAQVVVDLPLEEFARAIEFSDSIGPLLDPTAWISSAEGIRQWRDLVKPLIEFQRVACRLLPRELEEPEDNDDVTQCENCGEFIGDQGGTSMLCDACRVPIL